jgi:hypothetical protein
MSAVQGKLESPPAGGHCEATDELRCLVLSEKGG